jgi:type I restriction-modification system DNA methylase subunit
MPHSAQVTAAEISRMAGVTRATVSNWRRRHADFPAPTGGTETSPAYDLEAVRAWLASRNQLPASRPADDLRAALRALPADSTAPIRLLPLVLAADRMSEIDLKTLTDLSDHRLSQRAQKVTRPYADDFPGVDDLAYGSDDAALLRALLRCVQEEGAVKAAEVLAEGDVNDSGASGTYETPAPLAELMADLLAGPGDAFPASVFDPACGAGNLLVAAARRGAQQLYGQDVVPTHAAQAAVRLGVLTPTATSRMCAGDSLRADASPTLATEAALCAPPYGDRDWGHEELAYDPRWIYGLPPKGEPELAWLQHCLTHLAEGAPAVLLMPPATAERASGRRIRAAVLRNGALRAVVALPSGAAAPLHVGLHLWVLQHPDPQAATPQNILFVDTADPDARRTKAVSTTRRSAPDWAAIRTAVLDAWNSYLANPDGFEAVPGTARAVPVIDLLDEAVDLTPARHVRATPVATRPDQHAEMARALHTRLRRAATELANFSGSDWAATDDEPRSWRSAAVADLLRGGALTLLREEAEIQQGDVILPELLHNSRTARVAETRDAGHPLGRHHHLLRPDPERLDPWFLAGFLSAEDNVKAAATGASIVRVDARRLRVPLLPLDEQRRYGRAFQQLHALRAAADIASRLAEETARTLASGLTGGALLPPDTDPTSS